MTIKLNIHTNKKTYSINLFKFATSLLSLTVIIIAIIMFVNMISRCCKSANTKITQHADFIEYANKYNLAPTQVNYLNYLRNR
jgi:hypothetical protein